MNKKEYFDLLRERLSGLPRQETEERLSFYEEIIDDRMEEGLSEEEAIRELGTVEETASAILEEIPLSKIAKEKIRPKRKMKAWEIVLLAVGSPLWLTLLIVLASVLITVYAVLWSMVAAIWSIFGALASCAVGGVAEGIVLICTQSVFVGIAFIGAGLVLAGLSIFFFFCCSSATTGTVRLTKLIVRGIKRCFVGKEKRHA